MNETIRIIFFNLLIRLYLLRIIILSAFVAAVTSISIYLTYDATFYPIKWTALLVFILVHHIPIARPLKFFPGILDLSLAIGEIVAIGFFAKQQAKMGNLAIHPWFPEVVVYHAVSSWTLVACLVLFTIFRLASVIQSYGKVLIAPLDIFNGLWPYKEDRPTIGTLFFGRTLWKEHFNGESKAVRILRGLIGLGFIVLLVFYAMIHMVFQPIRETSLTPVQEYRTTIPPIDYRIDPMLWNIVIGPVYINDPAIQQDIIDSVKVVPLWGPVSDDFVDNCTIIPSSPSLVENPGSLGLPANTSMSTITYQCYESLDETPNKIIIPDSVLILVNHTTLPPSINVAVQSLNVVVGISNQSILGLTTLMAKSTSIPVIPGANLIAAIIPTIREVFVHPGLASFGMYELSRSIWVASIASIYSDPSISPDIARDPAVSSLRLYTHYEGYATSELRIVSDQRNNSVLAGFSAFGGLWTSLCGLFAIVFGGSLLHYLYGSKDISLLGAAHSFNHDRLREETLKRYPDIANEQNNHGLLALIRDHIINLDFLQNPPSTQPDVEKGPLLSEVEKKLQKNPVESTDSDTIEKPSNMVNSPAPPLDVNMPNTGLNDRDSLNILRPVRRRPDGA